MPRARHEQVVPPGGLQLPNIKLEPTPPGDGLPYSVYAEAMRELEAKNLLPEPEEPGDKVLPLPEDLSSRGAAVIYKHHHDTLRWWNYVSTANADVEARMVEQKANLEYVTARCKRQKIDPETDPEFIECKKKMVKLEIQEKRLKPVLTFLSRQMTVVSRSVEGLKLDYGHTVRGENLGKAPRGESGGHLPGP